MNDENLVRSMDRTPSERRALAIKAGKASGAARRARKNFKELMKIALAEIDLDTGDANDVAICCSMIKQAKRGDVRAFTAIRDTVDGPPAQKVDAKAKVNGNVAGSITVKWQDNGSQGD